jgi:hypothetical protein
VRDANPTDGVTDAALAGLRVRRHGWRRGGQAAIVVLTVNVAGSTEETLRHIRGRAYGLTAFPRANHSASASVAMPAFTSVW